MARFVFQLDGVLRHRQTVEDERQRALSQLIEKRQALEAELKALDQSVQDVSSDVRQKRLTGTLDLQFLAAHRRYTLSMQRRALAVAQAMASLQQPIETARAALLEASVQRKTLQTLRDRQLDQWRQDQSRRELAQNDEIVTQLSHGRLADE